MVSWEERPVRAFMRRLRIRPKFCSVSGVELFASEMMDVSADRMPDDVLIVEDDPIIALDFEDTILGFGVKMVRTAGSVTRALEIIADRAPDFALLDIGLVREKSFAIAERLDAMEIPFAFVTGYGADIRLPAAFAQKPRLPKPCAADALASVLIHRARR
jgi:CheY-like chemotaxis protein